MDLFGPNKVASLGGKHYAYVIVDDYSRFTWVFFLENKNNTLEAFRKFSKRIQNELGYKLVKIRSDQGGEFVNHDFEDFCDEYGITHNFSAPRTPQQNGVAERKNRTLQEMGRTMINEFELPQYFWAEAINTACHISNRVLIRKLLGKTPYELVYQRKPKIKHFRVFGCTCYILNTKDNFGKLEPKSDVGIFLGYSSKSKAYRVYNKRTQVIEESMHITFDEMEPEVLRMLAKEKADDLELSNEMDNLKLSVDQCEKHVEEHVDHNHTHSSELPKAWKFASHHPRELIIGDPSQGIKTRRASRDIPQNLEEMQKLAFVSHLELIKLMKH